jgi:hypothetical protein
MPSVPSAAGLIHLGMDTSVKEIVFGVLRPGEEMPAVDRIPNDEESVRRLIGGMVKSCGRRVLSDHAATLVSASSGRSMSTPFSNLAPARTKATRCGPLT